jgi:hypothetical protein
MCSTPICATPSATLTAERAAMRARSRRRRPLRACQERRAVGVTTPTARAARLRSALRDRYGMSLGAIEDELADSKPAGSVRYSG